MCHSSNRRNTIVTVGDSTGSCAASTDIGRSCTQNCCIIALCTAGTKFHNQLVASCTDHAVCFGCNQRLMVDGQKDHGFYQLRLDNRTFYDNNRLIWENWGTFLHCPDITFKMEVFKIIEELLIEYLFGAEVFNILLGKTKIFQIMNHLFQSCKNSKSTAVRNVAEKHIEHCDFVLHPINKITIGHRKFIVVCQHGQISFFCPVYLHHNIKPFFNVNVIFFRAKNSYSAYPADSGEPLSKDGRFFGS